MEPLLAARLRPLVAMKAARVEGGLAARVWRRGWCTPQHLARAVALYYDSTPCAASSFENCAKMCVDQLTLSQKSWCSLWKGGFGTNPPSGGPAESINKSTFSTFSNHLSRPLSPPHARARLRPAAAGSRRVGGQICPEQSLHLPSICAPLSPRALKRARHGGDALGLPSPASSCPRSDRPTLAARAGDRSAPNNLPICHRLTRSFRLAP